MACLLLIYVSKEGNYGSLNNKKENNLNIAHLILIIFFMLGIACSSHADDVLPSARPIDSTENIGTFYNSLARSLKGTKTLSTNKVLMKLGASFGAYQLEELERMNPKIKKFTRFEISFWKKDKKENRKSNHKVTKENKEGTYESSKYIEKEEVKGSEI